MGRKQRTKGRDQREHGDNDETDDRFPFMAKPA
jgi:hypothetical protein